ncbi:uncharacterized protein BDZ99DRAFT_470786 [Mytilinidion resinicola]|uniref:F-box domain-containing protein n=1 Tax=Mytilinidion resinicola TaxID=574789 RepID=A0A6A6ZBZ6_9PEZI|nr:uncharacterized protein BDZ99DRAFT_470786 [Mytilinidion resinicola]KAF2817835.1 hypothetical protein BDZ99DRAFT_470786 [Mytilinidion resinicola]
MGKRLKTDKNSRQHKQTKKMETNGKKEENSESQQTEEHKRECRKLGAFPSLALPGELRNRIYEHALIKREIVITSTRIAPIQTRRKWVCPVDGKRTYVFRGADLGESEQSPDGFRVRPPTGAAANGICLNLFYVSPQVYSEARPIFYAKNVFASTHGRAMSKMLHWHFCAIAQSRPPLWYFGLQFRDRAPIVHIREDGTLRWQWAPADALHRGFNTRAPTDMMEKFLSGLFALAPISTLALEICISSSYVERATNTRRPMKLGLDESAIDVKRLKKLRDQCSRRALKMSVERHRAVLEDPWSYVIATLYLRCKDNSKGTSLLAEGRKEMEEKRKNEVVLAEEGPWEG